jgi:hypothetical protein
MDRLPELGMGLLDLLTQFVRRGSGLLVVGRVAHRWALLLISATSAFTFSIVCSGMGGAA